MLKSTLTVAVVTFSLLGAPVAMAQNYNAGDALSASRLGATTCASFSHMGRTARASLVRRIIAAAPKSSLTSSTTNSESNKTGGGANTNTGSASAVPGTQLTAGALLGACQAASPTSTLKDAYSTFNSGTQTGK